MTEELTNKVNKSIERLKAFCPQEGYFLAFSGGKDSVVCKALLDMSGCNYTAFYRVTGIDPPELVRFIKEYHKDVIFEYPIGKDGKVATMWSLIAEKRMPPTRLARYCCKDLKEGGGDGRMVVTGVRWAESVNRSKNQGKVTVMGDGKNLKNTKEFAENDNFQGTNKGGVVLVNDNEDSRRVIEQCYKRHKTTVNPIIEWTDRDVWDFIKGNNIPYCSLYDEGWERIGCLGCPMAKKSERQMHFSRYPKIKNAYLMAFKKMIEERKKRAMNMNGWETPMDVFHWWMQDGVLPNQINLFDEEINNTEGM